MGSRGGRGRGRFGGGGFRHAKQEPFVLFPEIVLPVIDKTKTEKDIELVKLANKLHQERRDLPYFLKENFAVEDEGDDIERYSGKKRRASDRVSLENSGYMTLQPGYFPLELVQGTKRRSGRKVQWNLKRDLKKLDFFEGLEEKFDGEAPKRKNDGEESDDKEEESEPEDEEVDFSDDDYYVGVQVDDDDDDYNDVEKDDDEGGIL